MKNTFLTRLLIILSPCSAAQFPTCQRMTFKATLSSVMSSNKIQKSHESAGNKHFQSIVNEILVKLREDPRSLTTEDARRLSKNTVADDARMAKIISSVEAFAVANEVIHDIDPNLSHAPHTSLPTLINDLKVAVEKNPADVTTEVLRTAQNIVSSECTHSHSYRYMH
jgi:hypothetical protein